MRGRAPSPHGGASHRSTRAYGDGDPRGRHPRILREHETLDGEDVLLGFSVPLEELFAER
jgi:hypothetical protein